LDDLTNENRQEQNLSTLAVNPLLNKVAELKARDMAEKGYFSHVSPDGKKPWYWFKQAGYNYEYAGENLAVDFTDSQDVVAAWMNSPTHRANVLKEQYTEMETGIATGTYKGHETVFVAQAFGRPYSIDVGLPVEKKSSPSTSVTLTKIPSSAAVLGAESVIEKEVLQKQIKTNILKKYVTSPRHLASIAFLIIAAFVALALLLKLIIRTDKHSPAIITNGLILLALIFGVFSVNNYIANSKTMLTTSFVGFQAEEFTSNK
jgi:hypothetical protein